MKRWLFAVLVVGCAHAGQRESNALPSDVRRSSTEMSCNHCHATREAMERGAISPAPPWPGIMQRGVDVKAASQHCATERQGHALSASELDTIARFLVEQGPALPGQPASYSREPWTADDVRAAASLDGDALHGEQLFGRACTTCHASGPGPSLELMRAYSPVEVIEKVLTAEASRREPMPAFIRGQLSLQDVADVGAFVGGQR